MAKGRTAKTQRVFALISLLSIAITTAALIAGGTLFQDYTVRFWIFGLGGLGSIVGTHLYMAVRFADRNYVRSSLLYLGVLSVATNVVWFLLGLVVALPVAILSMSSRPSPYAEGLVHILDGTIFLPFQVGAWISWLLSTEAYGEGLSLVLDFIVTAGCLFVLSLAATGIYPRRKT